MSTPLQDLVLPVVASWRRQALDYAATGNYVPTEPLPSLGTFIGGWPNIIPATLGDRSAQPRDLSSLVGSKKDSLHPFAYEDIDGLSALFDAVLADPVLRDRFLWRGPDGTPTGETAAQDRMVRTSLAILVGAIVSRADAVGVTDERLDAELFNELDRAVTQESLPAELVVPLITIDFDFTGQKFAIGKTVWLERLDDPTQLARGQSGHSLSAVPDPLAGAAVVAITVGDVHIDNREHWRRAMFGEHRTLPMNVVDTVCEAIRLVTDEPVGYAQILLRPIGWADHWRGALPAITEVDRVRRYAPRLDNYGWLGARKQVAADRLNKVPQLWSALNHADRRTRLAARRLSRATLTSDRDDIALDSCIGIEALVGEGKQELVHRMSLRAATALAAEYKPEVVYTLCKEAYDYRSTVAHGGEVKATKQVITIGEHTMSAPGAARWLLRELLVSILTASPPWKPADLDVRLLEHLSVASEQTAETEAGPDDEPEK